jgi:hypothetical protein
MMQIQSRPILWLHRRIWRWSFTLITLLVVMSVGMGCVSSLEAPKNLETTPAVTPAASEPSQTGESDAPTAALSSEVSDRFLEFVAQDLDIPIFELTIAKVEPATWPDGCLGLAAPDEICTQALVNGWQIEVRHMEQIWIYRTDETAQAIRRES